MREGFTRTLQDHAGKNTNRVNRDCDIRPITRSQKRPIFLDTHCLLHRYLGEPTMSVGHSPFDDIEEFFMQRASDWAGLAVTDCNLIDGADWRDLRGGAGKEDFVRDVEHLARNHLLDHREA